MVINFHRQADEKERRLEKFAKEQWQNIRAFLMSRYSLSKDDCADVFNESLFILWNNLQEHKVSVDCIGTEKESNTKYFMTICRNKALERLRSNKRYADFTPQQDKDDDTIHFLPDKVDSLLALDEDYNKYQDEKDALVNTIISDLPPTCNELLWGYYGHGYSLRELASMYNYKSENSVKVTKHRCAKKFREKFNVEYKKIIKKYDDIYRRYGKSKRPSK